MMRGTRINAYHDVPEEDKAFRGLLLALRVLDVVGEHR
jgi:hypothetical protein